jgi:outer membrane protein assembly factor BamB
MKSRSLVFFVVGAIAFMCLVAFIALGGVWIWGQISTSSVPVYQAQTQVTPSAQPTSLPQSPKISSSPTRVWNIQGSNPVVGQNQLFVITPKGTVVAVDLNSGQQKWESEFGANQLYEIGGFLYVARPDQRIYALDEFNGEVKWKYFIPDRDRLAGFFEKKKVANQMANQNSKIQHSICYH